VTVEVRKIAYAVPVRVVDGVPHCRCCQATMIPRDGGWMCQVGAAVLDAFAPVMARLGELMAEVA
jgi:hypothetical protein